LFVLCKTVKMWLVTEQNVLSFINKDYFFKWNFKCRKYMKISRKLQVFFYKCWQDNHTVFRCVLFTWALFLTFQSIWTKCPKACIFHRNKIICVELKAVLELLLFNIIALYKFDFRLCIFHRMRSSRNVTCC
jgi:hypothetical protein